MRWIFVAFLFVGLAALVAFSIGVSVRRIVGLGLLATFFSTAFVLVAVLLASEHWALSLIGAFLLLTPFSAVGLIIVALATGRRWFAAHSAVLLALAMGMSAPWIVADGLGQPRGTRFTVLVFNVWNANGRPKAVFDLIKSSDADIVVLVEMTSEMRAHLRPLASIYPYQSPCKRNWGCDRLILSKERMRAITTAEALGEEGGLFSLTSIDISGCRLTLLATHLSHPFPADAALQQKKEAEEIAAAAAAIGGAKLIVGDFNAAPWSPIVQTVLQTGQLTAATGWGGTYPARLPSLIGVPIDQVLVGRALKVVSREILPYSGSDHYPVQSELEIVDEAECGRPAR